MKKRFTALLVVLLVTVFTLTACLGGGDSELVDYMQSQIDKLEGQLENMRDELYEIGKENDKLKEQNSEKDKEIEKLKDEIDKLEEEGSGDNDQLVSDLTAQVAALEAEIASLKSKDDENKNKIAELQARYDEKVAELEAEKAENAEALATLEAEYKSELEALEAENANLSLQITALEERIEELLNDKDYTVTFDINGGEGAIADQNIRYKMTVDEPTAPTKANYDFLGWYVGGVKAEFPYVITTNTEFAAEYAPTKYTIAYVVNGGVMPETYVTEYDVETSTTLPVPTRDLYLFEGWFENEKLEGKAVSEITAGEFGNRTFYAKWLSTTNGITYKLSSDGTYYTVTGYEGSDTVVVIPESVNDIPVTKIAENAFKGKQKITSITVPDSVTEIGNSAFYDCISLEELNLGNGLKAIPSSMASGCSKLLSIEIPDSVEFIGFGAFRYCSGLTVLVIPEGVASIGDYAFDGCSGLAGVVIGDSVNTIGCYAFSNCRSLTDLVIGDSVTSVGDYAFYYCTGLASIEIPDSVISIGWGSFAFCSRLTNLVIGDSVTSIGTGAFYSCSCLTDVVIGNSVATIGGSAFSDCDSLVSVVISNSVTSIGSYAFSGCYSLTSVTIPDSVTTIDASAFSGCSSLISVVIGDSVTSIGSDAFADCFNLYVIYNSSDLLIELGSTSNGNIAYYAKVLVENGNVIYSNDGYNYSLTEDGFLFREKNSKYELVSYIGGEETITLPLDFNGNSYSIYCMTGVVNVIIPEGITEISDYAFANCCSLRSVVIPESVISIGNYAFFMSPIDFPNLKSVTMSDNVKTIGDYAFAYCFYLTDLVIPDSVTTIGEYAFYGCSSLGEIYFGGTESDWTMISIESYNDELANATRYYYSEKHPTEEGNFWHWVDGEIVAWPAYVEPTLEFASNGDGTCYVSGIGTYTNTEIIVPRVSPSGDTVVKIGDAAFDNCTKITSIVLPDSITSIGKHAFYNCSSLESIAIPDSVESIGNSAFAFCSSLISIVIPSSMTDIQSSLFQTCTGLTSVVIPDSVTFIDEYAFMNCPGLTDVYYTGSAEKWQKIDVEIYNTSLTGAKIHYNYKP